MNAHELAITAEEALDQALLIGARELACWQENLDEDAARLARERGKFMRQAFIKGGSKTALLDKIKELSVLQIRITGEAKRLHAALSQELEAMRGQTRRFNGYHKAAKVTPINNRFVSRLG